MRTINLGFRNSGNQEIEEAAYIDEARSIIEIVVWCVLLLQYEVVVPPGICECVAPDESPDSPGKFEK